MKGKDKYEKNGEWGVQHGRLDDHEGNGIIDSRWFPHNLFYLPSHGEQTFRHEDGINHSEPHVDAKVDKHGVDIIPYEARARLDQYDSR
jgi:hypothetical protein